MSKFFRAVRFLLLFVLVGLFSLIFGWGLFFMLQFLRSLVGGA